MEKIFTKQTPKRERIVELLREGIPPEEIALQVNTTVEYVYKETSRYNKRNELIEMDKLESISGTNDELLRKGPDNIALLPKPDFHVASKSEQTVQNYYSFEPTSKDDLKDLYGRFLKNQDPAEVISAIGLHPDLVQIEHLRFQKIKSRNPFELQDLIISKIGDSDPNLEPLINKTKSGMLLTNTELLTLIHYKSRSLVDSTISKMISNPQILLPKGLDRIKCNLCDRFQPGIIIDKNSEFAKQHEEVFAKCICGPCWKKAMEIRKNTWNFGIYERTRETSEGAERVNSISAGASSVKTGEAN